MHTTSIPSNQTMVTQSHLQTMLTNILQVALAATVLVAATPASAELTEVERSIIAKLQGTIYVAPVRETAEGKLGACGFNFSAIGFDYATKNGAPIKIVGGYTIRANDRLGLTYALKLGAYDGMDWKNPWAPYNAFARGRQSNGPGEKPVRALSDLPGYALFAGQFGQSTIDAVRSVQELKELVVGFNRAPGQQDVQLLLDLTVADTQFVDGEAVRQRSDAAVTDFAACLSDLLKTVKVGASNRK